MGLKEETAVLNKVAARAVELNKQRRQRRRFVTRYNVAARAVEHVFKNFDKFPTYRFAFELMDDGLIRLQEICAIAEKHGITSAVVKTRRRDYLRGAF